MRHVIISFIVLFILVGCESKEEIAKAKEAILYKEAQEKLLKDIEIAKEKKLKEELLARQKALEEVNQSTLTKAGITMDNGKLTIDTNRAKDFFSELSDSFMAKSKKIDQELKDGNLTSTKDMGLEISNNSFSMDFNKTKGFLERWGKKIDSFSKEINLFTDTIDDKNLSNKY